jgi:hypothetical protein
LHYTGCPDLEIARACLQEFSAAACVLLKTPKATIPGLTEYGIQTIIAQKHSWHYLQLNKNHIAQPLYMIQVCLKGK